MSFALTTRAAIAAGVAASALLLTACGGAATPQAQPAPASASASAQPGDASHNAADASFAQRMIPHHRQAVAMSELALTRASSPKVKALATTIKNGQDPQIQTMSGWLRSWGESVPDAAASSMPGMSSPGMSSPSAAGGGSMGGGSMGGMEGMMSDADMASLARLTGAAFDTSFLRMMITHHQGAVRMADQEKSQGAFSPAKQMADAIAATQNAEIQQMRALLGG